MYKTPKLQSDRIEDLQMPYKLMTARLQGQLERERDPHRREMLEFQITILLAIIEVLDRMDHLVQDLLEKTAT